MLTFDAVHRPKSHRQRQKDNQHTEGHSWDSTKWTEHDSELGRVLIIDYEQDNTTSNSGHHTSCHEFCKKDDFKRYFLEAEKVADRLSLRLIHVQNASWAKDFLQKRFDMNSNKDIMATLSGNADYCEKTNQDARDIPLRARATPVEHNEERKINRASFECDFLKGYQRSYHSHTRRQKPWLEFRYRDKRNPHAPRYDIHVDEISVYLQSGCNHGRKPSEEACNDDSKFDNGNTIIIFSDSVTGSLRNSLIGARRGKETQWTRFATKLKYESARMDDAFISNCMEYVLNDIVKSILTNWSELSSICEVHVGILEQNSTTPCSSTQS